MIGPVVFAASWRELAELGGRHPGSPALVDPDFRGTGDLLAGRFDGLNSSLRSTTPLIHYAANSRGKPAPAVSGVSFAGRLHPEVDDQFDIIDATILRCIDVQRVRCLVERLRQEADPLAHDVFQHALNLSPGCSRVAAFSAALGLNERTLQRRCAANGMPPPKTLLSLARVYAVERLAEWSGQPSGGVALALGFSHRANYRRAARRLFGHIPSVIRRRGGTRYVEEVIVRILTAPRYRTGMEAGARFARDAVTGSFHPREQSSALVAKKERGSPALPGGVPSRTPDPCGDTLPLALGRPASGRCRDVP